MPAYLARRKKLSLRERLDLTESIQSSATPSSQNLGLRRDKKTQVSAMVCSQQRKRWIILKRAVTIDLEGH